MRPTDTAKDKVRKICDVLRRDTLEPAKKEAEGIVQAAHDEAQSLIKEAQTEANRLLSEAAKEIERQKNVFQSSLNQACKQSLEFLRESIEKKLFNDGLVDLLQKPLQDPKVISELIQAVVHALEKEGVDADLSVWVSNKVSAKEVNALLMQEILKRLQGNGVSLGSMQGGIEVRVAKENMVLDLTDAALKEMVADYIRKDFREILFKAN